LENDLELEGRRKSMNGACVAGADNSMAVAPTHPVRSHRFTSQTFYKPTVEATGSTSWQAKP